MSGNPLRELKQSVFKDRHLTNLQRLYLSDCKLTQVAEQAFDHLTNLIELDLSNNHLQQVLSRSTFEQLHHSLRKLSLANNPIQTIESNAFVGLTQLTILDLSNCQLAQLKPQAFHGLSQLKELKLHDNRLTQLPMSVMGDLRDYLIIDLFANPWHCDCELRQSIDWMSRHHIQQAIIPSCATPQRHKDIRWHNVKPEEFICPPEVINKQNELIVGAGSNVSLSCTARGSAPLTFVWFQDEKKDEKNMTAGRSLQNPSVGSSASSANEQPPVSTKLLEEKRYEIVEELGPPEHPNTTTSTLYLFNLKLTDTSLFLCWVDNPAGYTIANFSLIVNDSPPANKFGGLTSGSATSGWLRWLGLSQGDAQLGIISIGFVVVLVAAVIFLLMFKNSNRSSKSSQSSDIKSSHHHHHPPIATMSSAGKFAVGNRNSGILTSDRDDDGDSGDVDEEDNCSSSGSNSSCRKVSPKVIGTGELDGFIEHMRSGIINMDYHSMSPVIQFNNTLKKSNNNQAYSNDNNQQAMHHFPSASNASSIPYYGGGGNGSASMATTTSDLSPSSGSATSNQFNQPHPHPHQLNSSQQQYPPNLTNCDLQHQLHSQLTFDQMAPATTTTSYTSDYQSGYSEDPNQPIANHGVMMPPMYYDSGAYLHQQQPMYQTGTLMVRPANSMMGPQGSQLVLQDMIHNQQHQQPPTSQQQRPRYDSGFHIL